MGSEKFELLASGQVKLLVLGPHFEDHCSDKKEKLRANVSHKNISHTQSSRIKSILSVSSVYRLCGPQGISQLEGNDWQQSYQMILLKHYQLPRWSSG